MSEFVNEPPRNCPIVDHPVLPLIVVKSELIEEQRGTSSKTNKPYCIRKQTAYIYTIGFSADEFPEKMILQLRDGDAPYPKGWYTFLPQAFAIGDFGSIVVFPNLQRIAAPKAL